MRLFSVIARAHGPGLVRGAVEAARTREEWFAKRAREREKARLDGIGAEAEYERDRKRAADAEEARLDALVQEYALLYGADWRPQLYRSTRGWIDENGKPASQDMIDLHERLARD